MDDCPLSHTPRRTSFKLFPTSSTHHQIYFVCCTSVGRLSVSSCIFAFCLSCCCLRCVFMFPQVLVFVWVMLAMNGIWPKKNFFLVIYQWLLVGCSTLYWLLWFRKRFCYRCIKICTCTGVFTGVGVCRCVYWAPPWVPVLFTLCYWMFLSKAFHGLWLNLFNL